VGEESRLDVLEGRVEEQSRNWDRIFALIGQLDVKLEAGQRDLSSRIIAVDDKLTARIEFVEHRLDSKIEALDQKLDRKIGDLRMELSRQFRWTMGAMITLLGTMLTLGAGVITALLTHR
jgi:hypothetical protein